MQDLRIVLLLNKRLEIGVALNAAAHLSLGLCGLLAALSKDGASAPDRELKEFNFQNYADGTGNSHAFISALPLIVLRGRDVDIRKCRAAFAELAIPFVDYTNCMVGGDYLDQISRSRQTLETELEYFGICALGEKDQLDQVTRKYSLWR